MFLTSKHVRSLLVCLLFLAGSFAYADDPNDLNLTLPEMSPSAYEARFVPLTKIGDFRLSIDSQLIPPVQDYPSLEFTPNLDLATTIPPINEDIKSNKSHTKEYGALPSDYISNSIGFSIPQTQHFAIGRETPKLTIYGEFEQQNLGIMSLQTTSGSPLNENHFSRASLLTTGQNRRPQVEDSISAMASSYYFEATYNFLPSVSGRLSYRKSTVDALESESNLTFEGTVETSPNTQIKAGFNNDSRPDLTQPKSNKDSKVWTEFILKF